MITKIENLRVMKMFHKEDGFNTVFFRIFLYKQMDYFCDVSDEIIKIESKI